MLRIATASLLALSAFSLAVPALAQDEPSETVRMVIIYGDDALPEAQGDEILVVATLPENERYRIPEQLRQSDNPANTAWAQRVERFDFVGKSGTLSCSPSGAGGITGCTQQLIDAAYGAKNESSTIRFSQLIEAARAERLATIDETAAAEQARVEVIEREYLERLERERNAPVPGEDDAESLPQLEASGPVDDGGEDASGLDREPGAF